MFVFDVCEYYIGSVVFDVSTCFEYFDVFEFYIGSVVFDVSAWFACELLGHPILFVSR